MSQPIEEIDVAGLERVLADGGVVVDVRNPDEFEEARVPGVVPIPLPEFAARIGEVPPAEVVYVICRSGARSLKACEALTAAGRSAVNVAGGTLAWIDSGRPVEAGPT